MVLLNKISLEHFLEQKVLYSKLIRGKLFFDIELHELNKGKKLQIYLYRAYPQIQEFIKASDEKEILTRQEEVLNVETGVLRLIINDKRFMINNTGNTTITIREINFNNKENKIADFPQGKVAILIDIDFDQEIDNGKVKKELSDYFMEEQNESN